MNRPQVPCQGCSRLIVWVYTDKGKRMPLDLYPTPEGNVVLRGQVAHVLTKAEQRTAAQPSLLDDAEPAPRYQAHFATCPNASHFRRCRQCHHTPCQCKKETP